MSLIHILREDGIEDDVDETLLVKAEGVDEDEDRRVRWVEYRFPSSDRIVHRSVDVVMKRWPEGLGTVLGGIG